MSRPTILAAAGLVALTLQGCLDSTLKSVLDYTCSLGVETAVDAVANKKMGELDARCGTMEQGALAAGADEEKAQAVQDQCLSDGTKEIQETAEAQKKNHTDTCIAKTNAAANSTGDVLAQLQARITDYVNKNKDRWAEETALLLDAAINKTLDVANEQLDSRDAGALAAETRLFAAGAMSAGRRGLSLSGSSLAIGAALASVVGGGAMALAVSRARRQGQLGRQLVMPGSDSDVGAEELAG